MKARFVRFSVAAIVVACSVTISQAQAAQTAVNLSRLDREAAKLLKVIVAGEPPPGRCRYDTDWNRYELDADTKRLAHVEEGLAPQPTMGDFRTIIDPDHHVGVTAFCTDAELKSYTAERVAEFEAGPEQSMQIDRTLFSYPIFDRSRSRAVVIVTRLALDGRFRLSGRIGHHPAGLAVAAQEFRKVGGRWHFLRSHLLGIT